MGGWFWCLKILELDTGNFQSMESTFIYKIIDHIDLILTWLFVGWATRLPHAVE